MASHGSLYTSVVGFSLVLLLVCTWQVSSSASSPQQLPSEEQYPDYEDGTPLLKRHLGSIAAYSGLRSRSNNRDNYDDENNYKVKRFLGSLARGGWFPRQFRGFVQPSPGFQKRHIGSVARTGWLPYGRNREDYQY